MVGALGAVNWWAAVPPSDHEPKSYESTPRNWLGGAATPTVEFCATERVNGVADASPPTASRRPDGSLSKVSSTVLGSSRTEAVPRRPEVAVAVRPRLRWDGYSWSG